MTSVMQLRERCARSELLYQTEGEDELLSADREKCRAYLASHHWCESVTEVLVAYSVASVVSVFLTRIVSRDAADEWLWCIVGDLPSAYLVLDEIERPDQALATYADLMTDWIEVVRTGEGLDDAFPVNAEPSGANADALEDRLRFLRGDLVGSAAEHWSSL